VIPPIKNTVGMPKPWIASQRKVKIGYATGWLIFFVMLITPNNL